MKRDGLTALRLLATSGRPRLHMEKAEKPDTKRGLVTNRVLQTQDGSMQGEPQGHV